MVRETIAILGGGNGAHAAAADLTLRGFSVRLYEDARFIGNLQKVQQTKQIKITGAAGDATVTLEAVTTDLAEAISGVRFILVVVPAFAHKAYAKKLAPIVREGQIVFLLPGTLGSLVFYNEFKHHENARHVVLAETHTLPYATRLIQPGEVMVMSRFARLNLGVMPANRTEETARALSCLYDGLVPTKSILACGMSSINPTTHVPGVIMNAGRIEYAKGEFWFYKEGVTPCVARAIHAVDRERIAILETLGYPYEDVIHGIGNGIASDDVYDVISKDENFARIKGPDSTQNRYFAEDIPYGLTPWALLGHMLSVPCPVMDSMINIGSIVLERDCWTEATTLSDLGIEGMDLSTLHNYLYEGDKS